GALAGWWLGRERGAMAGLLAAALVWLALDSWRGARLLAWLRQGAVTAPPPTGGMWSEATGRIRRVVRSRELAAADAQRRLEEFLSAIRTSPNGVILLDPQGRIEWCNQTAADQFGIEPERDRLQQVSNLLRDPAFGDYYRSGRYDSDIVIPGPRSLSSRPVRLALRLHSHGEGRKMLLSRDVTAVEQAEAMRRDFVANVSHEIRTPLTVLAGFVETLQNLPLGEEDRARYLGLMAQQAQRMQTLVSDLLMLSRLEGGPLPGAVEWTAIGELMTQCEQEARALSASLGKSQQLHFTDPPAIEIAGSSRELLSALSNLVSNAVRYTPATGSIEVQWRALADGRGELSVRDSGPGIAPEHLSRLTERFYRVDRSRSRETGGTGLGLAIVKHVVQRHGAELVIDSTPGLGSTFAIRFPASRLRAVLSPPSGRPAQPATESLEE
ncbi:MAG TPA: phosphate regulon sensor histidine kinase PhoR, partial [Ramlibacter sp.]|nr:phosphate regulon sensor histidine kinase PhoR [Ramlibacter sp.]